MEALAIVKGGARASVARAAFAAAIAIGALHMGEHVVQVVQRYLLGIPNGNGVLGSVADLEPVHLIYNVSYLVGLIWVAASIRPFLRSDRVSALTVQLALTLQVWHVFEHYLKFAQYLAFGLKNGTGGFFGAGPGGLLPLVAVPVLHFVYNTAVFLPLLVVFARYVRSRARAA